LSPSPGAAARDAARSKQHPALSTRAAQLASADWYLRRAATTSQPSFCERARQMLTDTQSDQPQSDHELLALLQDLPPGRVAADPSAASIEGIDASSDLYQALAMYRLGLIDEVRGPALLVGHLAVVYGGALELPTSGLAVSLPPEEIVDRLAPGLGWEPDGLYAALRAVSRSA
jgi:hypothetical protein